MHHREGWRTFHADNDAEIRYEIAPLPDGVAMQMKAGSRCGDNHTVTIPWRACSSRNQALRAFLDKAQQHFAMREVCPEQKPVQMRMLALLEGIDPGFEEPAPEAIQQEKPIKTQVEKVEAKLERPVQRELFRCKREALPLEFPATSVALSRASRG